MEVTTSIRGDILAITRTIQASISVIEAKTLALSNSVAQVKLVASDQAELSQLTVYYLKK